MVAEGVLPAGRSLPGERYLYGFYNTFGETAAFMSLARAAARLMKGRSAEAVRRAGESAVDSLIDLVQPWALEQLGAHRAEGRLVVLATTSPLDLVIPLARALDFDDVIATRYEEADGLYTGRLTGRFAWGRGKREKVREWAASNAVDLADCHVYSDSVFDVPVLERGGPPPSAERRSAPGRRGHRPSVAPRELGPPPGGAERHRTRALPPAASLRAAGVVPVRPVHRRRGRARPVGGTGHPGVEPPQLLRRGRAGAGGRPDPPAGPVHGQAGALRRSGGRAVGPGARGDPGRPRHGTGRVDGQGHRRAARRRGRHRPAPGHHPTGRGLLRPGADRQDGRRPAGRRHRRPGRPHRAVGHRAGVAPLVQGAERGQPAAPAAGRR